ncbi:MAG: 4,5-DOPA dioxygenase extradiol [Saprospiraceae bacterium]|nr:4,5-DOPA dioxygenase extradiol [Candidatus Brachybacter algidus]MBK8746451.1 4,5-DOPA dioxygenase extradiol [Candidatus Brachybacter algidus]
MGLLSTAGIVSQIDALRKFGEGLNPSDRTPVYFFGHGSPMNAIEENNFTKTWNNIGSKIERPKAILCISAHWETNGTWVTAMPHPRTIHDFGGFPKALFDVQYPAKGSPEIANEIKTAITSTTIGLDEKWGLDHGAWSVVKHLYPDADIPVIQMSIDYTKPAEYHYNLAKQLNALRRKGILIIGSGNMVHNLGMVAWDKMNEANYAYDWATEANDAMKEFIVNKDHLPLINYEKQGKAFNLAIPSPDHYLPLLYALALQEKDENTAFFNDEAVMGSLTMTSVVIS